MKEDKVEQFRNRQFYLLPFTFLLKLRSGVIGSPLGFEPSCASSSLASAVLCIVRTSQAITRYVEFSGDGLWIRPPPSANVSAGVAQKVRATVDNP